MLISIRLLIKPQVSTIRNRNRHHKVINMNLLTLPEAAKRLGLQVSTLRFWVWTRRIEYIKVGRAVRLREDTVREIVEHGTVPPRRG